MGFVVSWRMELLMRVLKQYSFPEKLNKVRGGRRDVYLGLEGFELPLFIVLLGACHSCRSPKCMRCSVYFVSYLVRTEMAVAATSIMYMFQRRLYDDDSSQIGTDVLDNFLSY